MCQAKDRQSDLCGDVNSFIVVPCSRWSTNRAADECSQVNAGCVSAIVPPEAVCGSTLLPATFRTSPTTTRAMPVLTRRPGWFGER